MIKSDENAIAKIFARVMADPKAQTYGMPWKTIPVLHVGVRLNQDTSESLQQPVAPAA